MVSVPCMKGRFGLFSAKIWARAEPCLVFAVLSRSMLKQISETMKKRTRTLLLVLAAVLLMACGGKREKTQVAGASPETLAQTPEQGEHPGKKVYNKYCKACHQSNGEGVPGVFPPLTPNGYIADKKQIIAIVLNGMSGKADVNGTSYNGVMAAHSHLTNKELADVISYVRSSFGNKHDAVTPDEIEAAR